MHFLLVIIKLWPRKEAISREAIVLIGSWLKEASYDSYQEQIKLPMACKQAFAIFTILLALQLSNSQAKEFIVGDEAGWTTNFDYQAWAKDKVFHVGDTLEFKYKPGAHNVRGVNAAGFQNCAAPADSKLFDTGHDVITLSGAGEKWYICGVSSHCAEGGQKLAINVEIPDGSHVGEGAPTPPVQPGGTNSANGIALSVIQVVFAVIIALVLAMP